MVSPSEYRTTKNLFSKQYLDDKLPETDVWEQLDRDALRTARAEIAALWNREMAAAPPQTDADLERRLIRPVLRNLGISFDVEDSTSPTQSGVDHIHVTGGGKEVAAGESARKLPRPTSLTPKGFAR